MPLTPDIERANAKVEIAALLLKADNIRRRLLPDMEIHVSGFDVGEPGKIAKVRAPSFQSAVTLEDKH